MLDIKELQLLDMIYHNVQINVHIIKTIMTHQLYKLEVMNVLIIQNVNSVYSIRIKLMKNISVEKIYLIVVLSKTEVVFKQNVQIMQHVKIMMEIIKYTLICQKKSVYLVVEHNIHTQNILMKINCVINVVVVTDTMFNLITSIVLNQFVHHLSML